MATQRQNRSQVSAETVETTQTDIGEGKGGHLDVEKELAFYASYHSNKINVAIHLFCIPLILWSWMIITSHLPLPGFKVINLAPGLAIQPSFGLAWIVACEVYYILLEPFGGITYLPFATLAYLTGAYLATSPPAWLPFSSEIHPSAKGFAWTVFAFAWIAQFIGHGFFEKRAPALKENLVQAIVLAPFFVHLELLFSVFHYRKDLEKTIRNKAGIRIRDMNRAAKLK